MKKIFIAAIAAFAITSCEKEIKVDLNSADPQIIIEGNITNETGSYQVQISKSVNFSEANSYPAVSGASVVITDRTSNITDTLLENPAGIYKTLSIQGISGHSYDLLVSSEGQTYTASTTMPFPVPLDSITFIHRSGGFSGSNSIRVIPNFHDPLGVANNYTFNASVNSRKLKNTFVFGDRLSDGRYITQQLFMDSAYIQVGDIVSVNMNCVDKNVWDYFNTLALQTEGGVEAPAPANPSSNVSNNALGYFSAHTVQTKTAVAY
jgi:hypothetical protein